jgi:hypothetical protein
MNLLLLASVFALVITSVNPILKLWVKGVDTVRIEHPCHWWQMRRLLIGWFQVLLGAKRK